MMTESVSDPAATPANVEATPATPAAATPAQDVPAVAATPEATPAAEPAADPAKPAEPAAVAGAPESYADFTAPEGVTLDTGLLAEFKEAAKANNLPQDKAQGFVTLGAKIVESTIKSFQDAHAAQVKQWAEQCKADPVVGGPAYDANVAVALKAVADYGDADLKQVFDTYGLGNNPAMVRFAYRIGKAMSESSGVHGKGNEQPGTPKTLAGALWADDPFSKNVKTT